ncbi:MULTISPECIES: hypothetical protein [unclassified Streptomyces]|uniref:hypothetical protein n=1 Tax=unclassified Streptomyces TaxID=2593676 RepID=UPI000A924505|nr:MULTISPECIES: hypothetical protein [unclassified Streptomyces]
MTDGTQDDTIAWLITYSGGTIGSLSDPCGDQPWTIARFHPGGAWEEVRSAFEDQAEARRMGFPKEKVGAIARIKEMAIQLESTTTGEVIEPVLIYIEEGKAKFRD